MKMNACGLSDNKVVGSNLHDFVVGIDGSLLAEVGSGGPGAAEDKIAAANTGVSVMKC